MNILNRDLSLLSGAMNVAPGEKYDAAFRRFQGIPAIERSREGRLWTAFYSGGVGEGPDNYVALIMSSDDGHTWTSPILVIDPPEKVRAFDPCLWMDPLNRLWLFWSQSYGLYDGRCGVWASICPNPDAEHMQWTEPRRIAPGIMLNKPTVLSTGEWLFPTSLWAHKNAGLNHLQDECYSNVYVSRDQGASFLKLGFADVPNRHCDEHMIVERRDGSLWMLVRTTYGIGESVSIDQGKTWSPGKPTRLGGPNSRFFIRRLRSGRLLLVNHYGYNNRSHLTAQLSEDDGLTWSEGLLLDERDNISYPDGTETPDGTIYIVYDRERRKDMEILLAVFKEVDMMQGSCISPESRLKVVINRAGLDKHSVRYQDLRPLLKYRNLMPGSDSEAVDRLPDDEAKRVITRAIRYMDDHLLQIQDLKEVSDELGYSLSHLSRLFSKVLGIALQDYYINRKWQRTMELLEDDSLSITKIASMMKYESIHTFSRAFKNVTGLSPTQYIRKRKITCEATELLKQCEVSEAIKKSHKVLQ
jgi:AraC-like DNA-binding protein/predicted neuraminidase